MRKGLNAEQLAQLQMETSTMDALARSKANAAANTQETALRDELATVRAALSAAEAGMKLKSEVALHVTLCLRYRTRCTMMLGVPCQTIVAALAASLHNLAR